MLNLFFRRAAATAFVFGTLAGYSSAQDPAQARANQLLDALGTSFQDQITGPGFAELELANAILNGDTMLDRLEPYWQEVPQCSALTYIGTGEYEGKATYYLSSFVPAEQFVDLACEMETVGNRVTHVAPLAVPDSGMAKFFYYYRVALNNGSEIVVEHQGPIGTSVPLGNVTGYVGSYGRVWSFPDGAWMRFDIPDQEPGSIDTPVPALLLGRRTVDLSQIGIEDR